MHLWEGERTVLGVLTAMDALQDGSTALMVALDAGQSEIASMLYSRMNIKCSVSLSPGRAEGGELWEGTDGCEELVVYRP